MTRSQTRIPTAALELLRKNASGSNPRPFPCSRRFLSASPSIAVPSSTSSGSNRPHPTTEAKTTLAGILTELSLGQPGSSSSASAAAYRADNPGVSSSASIADQARYLLPGQPSDDFIKDVETNRDNILHVGNVIPPRQAYTLPVSTPSSSSFSSSTLGFLQTPTTQIVGSTGLGIPPRKDPLVDLMTNLMMKHGRKAEAERRMADILALIQRSTNAPPLPFLHAAISLTSPLLRLRTLRRSSKNIPLPTPLDARQSARAGILAILKAAERGRAGGLTRRSGRIVREVLGVVEWGRSGGVSGGSEALKRKEEVHRLGAVNRSNLNVRG